MDAAMISRKTAIAVTLFAILAAYTGYWFYARSIAVQAIDNWAEQRRAEGYTVGFAAPEIGGFPLLIRAVLAKPHLQRDALEWRGERMKIELQPWSFRKIRIDLEGKQWLTLQEGAERMTLAPSEAAIVARLSETGRLDNAALLMRDLQVTNPASVSLLQAAEIWLEAKAPQTPPASHADESLALALSAADIVLPKNIDGPLGRNLAKLRADLQIRGAVPGGAFAEAVETWRRSGGTVDVDWFQVNWGELDLRAKGTVALDDQSRPLGAFSTDIRGHNHAVDALVALGVLELGTATMTKIGLALLAKSPPEGGPPVLTLPVTAQDGHLYAGPLKVLDLDPIRLPTLQK